MYQECTILTPVKEHLHKFLSKTDTEIWKLWKAGDQQSN